MEETQRLSKDKQKSAADLYKQDSGKMLQGEKNKEKLFKAAETQEGKVLQIKREMAK